MKKMKALVVLCLLLNVLPSYALGFDLFGLLGLSSVGDKYEISGMQNPYINVTDLATGSYVQKEGAIKIDNIVPVSALSSEDLKNLKRGEAEFKSILQLVSFGDAGVYDAARNGGIKQVYYVDKEQEGFNLFGLSYCTTRTIVYGE